MMMFNYVDDRSDVYLNYGDDNDDVYLYLVMKMVMFNYGDVLFFRCGVVHIRESWIKE